MVHDQGSYCILAAEEDMGGIHVVVGGMDERVVVVHEDLVDNHQVPVGNTSCEVRPPVVVPVVTCRCLMRVDDRGKMIDLLEMFFHGLMNQP